MQCITNWDKEKRELQWLGSSRSTVGVTPYCVSAGLMMFMKFSLVWMLKGEVRQWQYIFLSRHKVVTSEAAAVTDDQGHHRTILSLKRNYSQSMHNRSLNTSIFGQTGIWSLVHWPVSNLRISSVHHWDKQRLLMYLASHADCRKFAS